MASYDAFITVTSWEDRFVLGIERFLTKNFIRQAILFNYDEHIDKTEKHISDLRNILGNRDIENDIVKLKHNDTINNWRIVKNTIDKVSGSLIIDMSTMPRDIIYFSLYHAERSKTIRKLYCLYNGPKEYSKEEWLTRDPCKPQLVYNMSGISEMGKDTVLILMTGFDRKRVEQLLNYYEPRRIYLGLQEGEQYKNNILNAKQYIEYYKTSLSIDTFYIDAFLEGDYGFRKIEEIVKDNNGSNIITASLGPKPSSIALFRLNKKYPYIGLIYVPVSIYNMNYSSGINESEPIFEQIK